MERDVECGRCKCLVRSGDTRLVWLGMRGISWDSRPKGPAGWRIGEPEFKGNEIDDTIRVCWRCDPGRTMPQPPVPLWRAARAAWDSPEGRALAVALKSRRR